jgi:hypothetical protein
MSGEGVIRNGSAALQTRWRRGLDAERVTHGRCGDVGGRVGLAECGYDANIPAGIDEVNLLVDTTKWGFVNQLCNAPDPS